MKLKDIKPGMVVAIGSIKKTQGRWGSWHHLAKGVVVAIGNFGKEHGYGFRATTKFVEHARYPKSVLVAREALDDTQYPDIVKAQHILCSWKECEEMMEQEQEEIKNKQEVRREFYEHANQVKAKIKELGLSTHNFSTSPDKKTISLPLDTVEQLVRGYLFSEKEE